ncbi:hypothetical protein SAMN04488523_12115 [Sulfitobacter brevis]|uniref:Uncharacterized protein n=1 Tax=Sulfitobacter brevis TaxID=74348 RepID=A0A1I2GD18_9RHOB|nr:hypothetical protein [Sulfitobacter brevis]SFF14561.1 hypothetical protein SAMN04488523_12115 [Sulfitobacter brevis]
MSTKQRRSLAPAVNGNLDWGRGTDTAEAPAPAPKPAPRPASAAPEKVRKVRKQRVTRDSFSTRVETSMLNLFYEHTNDAGVSVVDALDEAMRDFLIKKSLM